jgi:acyl transferase domain-containing protein
MAAGLYPDEPVFADAMDEVLAAMGAAGRRLRDQWLRAEPTVSIDHVTVAQPLLFALDYALGRLVASWVGEPVALLGHCIGEIAAAALASVLSVADAAALVVDRVERLAAAPPGGLLAVQAAPEELAALLGPEVCVGAVNAPRQTVLAGLAGPLERTRTELLAAGLRCKTVPALTPFHHPVLAEFSRGAGELVRSIPVGRPRVPIYSGYTAGLLGPADIGDWRFWTEQPVRPVLFRAALDVLLAKGEFTLVEAGPGRVLAGLARRHPAVRSGRHTVHGLLAARPGPPEADRESVRRVRAALTGVEPALRC